MKISPFYPQILSKSLLLETLPVLVGAAYMLLQKVAERRAMQYLAMAFMAALIVANNLNFLSGAWKGYMNYNPREVAEIGRVLDATVKPDAVVFFSGRTRFALGTHRNYRSYDLESFTSGFGQRAFAPFHYRPYNPAVMQQESRRARFAAYYQAHTDAQLRELKSTLAASFLDRSRQVVYLLPSQDVRHEQQDLGPGFELHPLKVWETRREGTWGIYAATRRAL